jgi:hypothetical protein
MCGSTHNFNYENSLTMCVAQDASVHSSSRHNCLCGLSAPGVRLQSAAIVISLWLGPVTK